VTIWCDMFHADCTRFSVSSVLVISSRCLRMRTFHAGAPVGRGAASRQWFVG